MIQILVFLSMSFVVYFALGSKKSKKQRGLIAILMPAAVVVVASGEAIISNYFDKPDKLISEYIVAKSIPNCESNNREHSTDFTIFAPYVIVEKTKDKKKEKRIPYKIIYYSGNKFYEKSLDEIRTIVFINSYKASQQTYAGGGGGGQFTATREGVNLVFTDVQTRECLGQESIEAPEFPEHATYSTASQYVSRGDIKKLVEERIRGIRRPQRWWNN